jgi:CubicO group peptidase (beta-lactamase class C family)
MIHSFVLAAILAFGRPDTSAPALSALDTSSLIAGNTGLFSILISRDGKVVYERYFNGHTADALCNNQSLTKSIVSLLIGIAIDKGYIRSIDESLGHFFPSLTKDPDPRKRRIRIRDIMNQASGLWHEDLTKLGAYLKLPDPSGYVLAQPLVSVPGAEFHYNNAATHLLSLIITKSTGMSTHVFAQKFLFGPLGIRNVQWDKLNDGYDDGAGLLSVHTRTKDMLVIGNLLLNAGVYRGRRIVSAAWVSGLFHPERTYPTPWGFSSSRYALCYYHYVYRGESIMYGLGWGGQFLFLIPGRRVVITVNQDPASPGALQHSIDWTTMVFPMIWKKL